MEQNMLGRTGWMISRLGYGAMELRHLTEPDAGRMLNAVLDAGINYIDTSPDYGHSEDYIGNTIAHRRDEYILASKCGCHIDDAGQPRDPRHIWSRAQLLTNIETSLRRLKTDHLDVWQLHGAPPDELTNGPSGEVIETMLELKRQGKVRAIGMSYSNGKAGDANYPARGGFLYLPTFAAWNVFNVMQIVYGGLTRQNESLIAHAATQGIGMVIRGVVKKYYADYPARFAQAKLAELCTDGESMDEFLIRFALNHPGIHTMIIGTKDPQHLAANVAAVQRGKLPDAIYAEAQRRLDGIGVVSGG